jgi:hypothetical protein
MCKLTYQQCDLLRKTAEKSHIYHQHAAMISYNGKPIAFEKNFIQGPRTFHAEFAAIRRVLLDRGFLGWFKERRILWGQAKQRFERNSSQDKEVYD